MKRRVYYDGILKDLFQYSRLTLLDELTGGVAVQEVLSAEFPLVQERRADLILLLADQTMLHIEFQSGNHRYMAHRMGIYGLLASMRYDRPMRQVVIYLGEGKMRMSNRLVVGRITVEYHLMDIREMDARKMLHSDLPGDYVLALLASGGGEILREIVERANQLKGLDRERVLMQLAMLAGLRRLSNRLRMEYEAMGIAIDIDKNVILKDIWAQGKAEGRVEGRVEGKAEGRAEGKAEGKAEGRAEALIELLQAKFVRVPKWAQERIAKATPERLASWTRKTLTADSIEDVVGKR